MALCSPKQAKAEVPRHQLHFCVGLEATLLLEASGWQLCSGIWQRWSLSNVWLSALSAISFTYRLEHRYLLNKTGFFKSAFLVRHYVCICAWRRSHLRGVNDDGGAEEERVLGAAMGRVPAGRAGPGALFGGRGRSLSPAVRGVSPCPAALPGGGGDLKDLKLS